jgi:hypothetical protein
MNWDLACGEGGESPKNEEQLTIEAGARGSIMERIMSVQDSFLK